MNILSTLRDLALSLFIAILIPTTLYYGYEIIVPYPVWNAPEKSMSEQTLQNKINDIETEKSRIEDIINKLESVPASDITAANQLNKWRVKLDALNTDLKPLENEIKPYRDAFEKERDTVSSEHQKNEARRHATIFYTSLLVSVVLITAALFIPYGLISTAFILGAIFSGISGFIQHGYQMGSHALFGILIFALIFIVVITIYVLRREKREFSTK